MFDKPQEQQAGREGEGGEGSCEDGGAFKVTALTTESSFSFAASAGINSVLLKSKETY